MASSIERIFVKIKLVTFNNYFERIVSSSDKCGVRQGTVRWTEGRNAGIRLSLSMETWAWSTAEDGSPDYNRKARPSNSKAGLFPVSLSLLPVMRSWT
nr:Regulator of rDNA transcription protein 15 [Ipomoea batatas]